MNSRVENFGRRPAHRCGNQLETILGINRSLVLGENDQCRPALVEARVHSGCDLHAATKRESNVNAIAHFVGGKRAFDFLDDFFARWNFCKR